MTAFWKGRKKEDDETRRIAKKDVKGGKRHPGDGEKGTRRVSRNLVGNLLLRKAETGKKKSMREKTLGGRPGKKRKAEKEIETMGGKNYKTGKRRDKNYVVRRHRTCQRIVPEKGENIETGRRKKISETENNLIPMSDATRREKKGPGDRPGKRSPSAKRFHHEQATKRTEKRPDCARRGEKE